MYLLFLNQRCCLLQVMIGASEVGSVKPLVKEGQHVKKVGVRTVLDKRAVTVWEQGSHAEMKDCSQRPSAHTNGRPQTDMLRGTLR